MTGCGSTGEHKTLVPLPWNHKVAVNHGDIDLPAAGSGRGGYYKDDGPGRNIPPGLELVPDAIVRAEPYAKWANRPYSVFGQTYNPILHEEPFNQRGVASWYGVKFHGQRTSSGEPYDMYKMTAAHPTLPIPSYARITSVATGKSVVVRINDRGPFHASRIVDVSYTAALKLGLLGKGSHEVELERLFPNDPSRLATVRRAATSQAQTLNVTPAPPDIAMLMLEDRVQTDSAAAVQALPASQTLGTATSAAGFWLQLGAYSRADKAQEMSRQLADAGVEVGSLEVAPAGSVHRLYGGPFGSRAEAQQAAKGLPSGLGLKPIVVKR
ncbi:septal ring lytic transglycosylase RlpA family protein [Massilia sp. Leaf139]|uniref:septal ring lytic transglycosylase RlpA family protein n=1 Tax=Massilia sp. Leaf139 TaxID=1736272 RepID=UPI001E62259F|nr:septal ring lytic transglycosylase RlpA family protein [Massilia sp. Leaf139]